MTCELHCPPACNLMGQPGKIKMLSPSRWRVKQWYVLVNRTVFTEYKNVQATPARGNGLGVRVLTDICPFGPSRDVDHPAVIPESHQVTSPASKAVLGRVRTRSTTRARHQNGQEQRHPSEVDGPSLVHPVSRVDVSAAGLNEPCPTIVTVAALVHLLQSAGVVKLVDVRSIPRSRTNPQFNRGKLLPSTESQAANTEHVWLGDAASRRAASSTRPSGLHRLETMRGTWAPPTFREAWYKSCRTAGTKGSQSRVVRRCGRMIADVLVVKGCNVEHLGVQRGPAMNHRPWDIARLQQ
ncbi:HhH-GPD domain-containing protein [Metarhizium acridum CQMa 102]|uniref:HhH-GPD domain-containing protein n=1 Tax=Metarhizium acridum (strain CQMa 102) TaxID=655827 RepID=E9E4K7_METAQ|nr:HhH-GPD domain-containing protein [Metarhizium acridum CQMa 102]EFY89218.1 HhH-GPD domain-containing protein [Metarhizium acridum CQMa 102]